jgi:hypothetical protein
MSFKQGYEEGQVFSSLLVRLFKYGAIPAFGGMFIWLMIHRLLLKFNWVDVPMFKLVDQWVGWVAGGYFLYLMLGGESKPKATIATPSVTTKTTTKVKAGVYNLATWEKDIPMIKITEPYRHLLVAGGPGSGKSFSVLEPILVQAMQQGKAGLIYDYKFPTFARLVASSAKGVQPFYINFDDLSRSHRVNPIAPQLMTRSSFADQYARTVVYNLIPDAATSANPFFADSAQGYLAAIFWFLREEHPQYCTLPHAMALAMCPAAEVVTLLETNEETRNSIAAIREALSADAQRAAIVGTLQNGLRKINSKEIAWVLSGDDFTLDLNNPDAPKALVLGNNADLDDVYGPVLALLATVALKQMNQKGKADSIALLDEFPTFYLPNFDTYPATARSNKVAIVVGIQDFAQLEGRYGKTKKNAILGTLSNQFYGLQNNLEGAQYVSDLWGKEDVQTNSINQSQSTGLNQNGSAGNAQSLTERQRIRVQDVTNLEPGQFYGKLVESDFTSFKARMKGHEWPDKDWQAFADVSPDQVTANYQRIQQEARSLLLVINTAPTPETPVILPPAKSVTAEPKQKSKGPELADEF